MKVQVELIKYLFFPLSAVVLQALYTIFSGDNEIYHSIVFPNFRTVAHFSGLTNFLVERLRKLIQKVCNLARNSCTAGDFD